GLIKPWADRVDVVTTVDRSQGLTLVRPDGYVAWATDTKASIRRDAELRSALIAWCGEPACAPLTGVAGRQVVAGRQKFLRLRDLRKRPPLRCGRQTPPCILQHQQACSPVPAAIRLVVYTID